VPSPWPSYNAEKGRTLGKAYGIKVWFYWDHIEEHIGNFMGTENSKKKPLGPRPKRNQIGPLSMYVEPSPWLHQIFISKTVCHHFSPGLLEGLGCTLYGRIYKLALSLLQPATLIPGVRAHWYSPLWRPLAQEKVLGPLTHAVQVKLLMALCQ